MYTDIVSYQIVIALLKKYGIKNLVLSPGTRHTPFVRSVENDDFFNLYSVVDERSASFFAIGLIQEQKEPVAICCTSGTSVSNYVSGMTEAYYRQFPLIAITSDRNNYYLYQQEEQCVPQANIFHGICKKNVNLPFVESKKDFWYCSRLVNEALLELNHHGSGPVHINVPVEEKLFSFTTEQLPNVIKINRIQSTDEELWRKKARELSQYKRIIVAYGQKENSDATLIHNVQAFTQKYSAIIMVEHLSNLHCDGSVNAYNALHVKQRQIMEELSPDLVIFVNGNSVEIRDWLKYTKTPYQFWNVREDGMVSDPLRCLTDLFECDTETFFEKIVNYAPEHNIENTYLADWKKLCASIKMPEFYYSDIYTAGEFVKNLPEHTLVHFANSNSVRLTQHFPIKSNVTVMCNRGVNGIDGSLSTFIGQSYVHKGLACLIIGDLSFFYDMNGLWNRYVGKNVRIMLNNNGCGEIFYGNKNQDKKSVGKHIAADHNTTAKGWVESLGFKYLSAKSKEEFDENLKLFFAEESDAPIFFEVFTDKYVNVNEAEKIVRINTEVTLKSSVKGLLKKMKGE